MIGWASLYDAAPAVLIPPCGAPSRRELSRGRYGCAVQNATYM